MWVWLLSTIKVRQELWHCRIAVADWPEALRLLRLGWIGCLTLLLVSCIALRLGRIAQRRLLMLG